MMAAVRYAVRCPRVVPHAGGDVRPWGESGSAGVRCPRWGREAPIRGGTRWCEAPVSPQGGPPWGYCATHIRRPLSHRSRRLLTHAPRQVYSTWNLPSSSLAWPVARSTSNLAWPKPWQGSAVSGGWRLRGPQRGPHLGEAVACSIKLFHESASRIAFKVCHGRKLGLCTSAGSSLVDIIL